MELEGEITELEIEVMRLSSTADTLEEILQSVQFHTSEGSTLVSWVFSGSKIILKFEAL